MTSRAKSIENLQNAIQSHHIREKSLERVKQDLPISNSASRTGTPNASRKSWTSDQRKALSNIQGALQSHKIRKDYLDESVYNEKKIRNRDVENVTVALKSHQERVKYFR